MHFLSSIFGTTVNNTIDGYKRLKYQEANLLVKQIFTCIYIYLTRLELIDMQDGKIIAVTEYNATDKTVISLFCDKQILHKAESIFKYPEHAL